MTKFQGTIAAFLLLVGMILPLSLASAEETSFEDVQNVGKVCLNDYYSVVFTIRNEEMRRAYFSDMFTMSWCQINDVLPLYDEYEEIKDQSRADAANCGTVEGYDQKIKEYEEEMVRNLLEVYFIRNVKVEARNASDLDDVEDRKDAIMNALFLTMVDEFVEKEEMLKEDELEAMFAVWRAKYDDKSLMETIKSLNFSIDQPERKSFKEVVTPDLDANIDLDDAQKLSELGKDVSTIGQGVVGTVKYFYDHITYKIQERKSEQIASGEVPLSASSTSSDSNFPSTFEEYLTELNESTTDYDVFEAGLQRMAEYDLLYGQISAVSTTNTVVLIDQLNQVIINNNVQDFPAIRGLLAEVYGKQCTN